MELYTIVEVDGIWRAAICKNNKADKYGTPKLFTHKEAVKWIEKHSYKGMSFHYEIVKKGEVIRMGKYKSAIKALSATYRYFDDVFLLRLRDDIYKKLSEGNETYVIPEFPDNGMDTLIYSWLVMMCGDYGTSPKVGWIDDLQGAVKWLDEFMEDWKDGN